MSTERDVNRIVRSWLDDGVNVLPDRVLDAVLDQLPATPQRRAGWLARRFSLMNNNVVRVALAAAAVVVLAVVGIGVLLPRDGFGGPQPTPTASPLPSPTASPVTLTYEASGTIRTLAAGTYSIPPGRYTPAKLTFTMPAGWDMQYLGFTKHRGESGELGWSTDVVDHVYTDTCAADGTLQPIGPTVDDLVTALEQLGGATVSPAVDTTVGGYAAKRVDIVLPDVDLATCRVPTLQIWADAALKDFFAQQPRDHTSVYIVDVAGKVLAIMPIWKPASSAQDIAEMNGIISSMQIEPAAP